MDINLHLQFDGHKPPCTVWWTETSVYSLMDINLRLQFYAQKPRFTVRWTQTSVYSLMDTNLRVRFDGQKSPCRYSLMDRNVRIQFDAISWEILSRPYVQILPLFMSCFIILLTSFKGPLRVQRGPGHFRLSRPLTIIENNVGLHETK
jgi:hypothetical protein